MGKRMDDWLVNMGDWNISRRRYYGLPLPFYPCSSCGHLTVIGSRQELAERATGSLDGLQELRRPWIDDIPIACAGVRPRGAAHPGGRRRLARRRHRPVLDARVGEPDVDRRWLRQRRGRRADRGRPPRPRLLGGVVPRRLGVGDARADPPVVLLAAVHVGRPHRSGAVPQGARLREDARRDRPRDAWLVGQPDRRPGGVRADGRRRDALAVLPAAAVAGPAVRLQARLRDPAQGADAVEQRGVLHPVRRPRRLHAVVRRSGRRPARARTGWTSGPARSPTASSPRRPRATRATSRSTCCGRSSSTSTTCRTGTSGGRAGGSGTATRPRCARCGCRSCRACAPSRPCCRSSPSTCGSTSSRPCARMRRARSSSPAGRSRRRRRRTARRRRRDAQGHRARPPRPLGRQAAAAPTARHARRRRRRRRPLATHVEEIAEELRVKRVVFGRSRRRRSTCDRTSRRSARASAATSTRCAKPWPPATSRCSPTAAASSPATRSPRRTSSSSGPRRRGGPSRRARTTR